MDYEQMLEKAKKELPQQVETKERLEIPTVKGHIEGNKTIINNFVQIAQLMQRDQKHFLKYVLKELAAPGEVKNNLLTIGSKIPAAKINEKIQKYFNEYVVCKECGKPDTKFIKEGEFAFVKCQACGAKHSVRANV
ncbi:translation initiation factor IF-2 subunit beta [Candidatus Woesearchaeota archaeon]|nr:MAG: translation initiation factor IF-2 subunit beta [Candidatus Woesearchaeota archaeon]